MNGIRALVLSKARCFNSKRDADTTKAHNSGWKGERRRLGETGMPRRAAATEGAGKDLPCQAYPD